MSYLNQCVGKLYPYVDILPPPILGNRAPTSSDTNHPKGQLWIDQSASPVAGYIYMGGGTWQNNNVNLSTDATFVAASNTTASSSLAIKTYADNLAIAGAPDATEGTKGIAELATQAETIAYTDDARIVTPLKLGQAFAAPAALGTGTPAAATFTGLTATGGTVSLTSTGAAGLFDVTGAGFDLTLSSDAGRVVMNGEEAAADALRLLSAAGGLDCDVALQMNLTSSQNAADAIRLNASAGGIDIDAAGAAGEDIDIANAAGSINLTAGEAIANAMVLTATTGGIDLTAGGAAGRDIDITCTSGSINLTAGENVADSIRIASSIGGIDILANGAVAGEDIDIQASSSINLLSTENAAQSIYLRANGGTSETMDLHVDQGTGVTSLNLRSDVGGVTVSSGLASADAINITASNAAGGIDVDAGTAGFIVDTTGGISLDSAAASNFTATGAFDITVQSTAGSVLLNGGEAAADALNFDAAAGGLDVDVALQMNLDSSQAAADAIRINASNLAGGLDLDCGTGGAALDSTGAISLDGAAASNFSVSGAGFDLTLASSGGRVVVNGEEAAADALRLLSAAGGLDCDVALQMNLTSSQNAADAIRLNASAGGIDIDAAGAAGEDITIDNAAGSVKITSGEAIADSMVLTSVGGLDVAVTGGAGLDIDVTNTSGSMNITIGENVSDALVINCSGAASGMSLDAGTLGITMGTGLAHVVTSVATAASPYAVLGTDYFITTNTTGGVLTLTLPAAPATGRTLIVYDGAGQAAIGGAITVDGNGNSVAMSGTSAASKALSVAYSSVKLTYNGTLWLGQYTA